MKRIVLGIIGILMVISLAGCAMVESIIGNPEKTYGEYMESLLDVKMKGDYDKYLELTGSDEQAVGNLYDASMKSLTDTFIHSYGIKTDDKDIYNKMLDLVKELCFETQYQTSEAIKSDGNYIVTVTINPLDFVIVAREDYNSFLTQWTDRYNTGELVNLTTEEYDIQYAEELIDVLKDSLAKTSKQDTITIDMMVLFSADTYYVSEEDFMNLQDKLFTQ